MLHARVVEADDRWSHGSVSNQLAYPPLQSPLRLPRISYVVSTPKYFVLEAARLGKYMNPLSSGCEPSEVKEELLVDPPTSPDRKTLPRARIDLK